MKSGSFIRLMVIVASLAWLGTAQAELYLRFTFNEVAPGADPNDYTIADVGFSGAGYYGRFQSGDDWEYHPTYVAAPGGTALHFDPDMENFIALRKNSAPWDVLPADIVANGMSIAYWLRFEPTSDGYMSLYTTRGNSSSFELIRHTLKYPVGDAGPYETRYFVSPYTVPPSGQTVLDADNWHHLAWTVQGDPFTPDSQTQKFYIDGELRYTQNNVTVQQGMGTATRVGITFAGGNYVEPFAGDIDQVDIYDGTLSADEVATLFDLGPSTSTEPPAPEFCRQAIERGYSQSYDLNADCRVNLGDFALFTGPWLACMDPLEPTCSEPWLED